MTIIYHVIGLEGCGHHGLEGVVDNIIKNRVGYVKKGHLNNVLLPTCRNSNNQDENTWFGYNVEDYLEGENFFIYTDDSYPSGGDRETKRQKNIGEIYRILNRYGEVRFLYLQRNIYNTINSHPNFDGDILTHTEVLVETKHYVESEIEKLRQAGIMVYDLNYEDIDNAVGQQIIADFIDTDLETVKVSVDAHFKKSTKDYTQLLDEKTIREMAEIIGRGLCLPHPFLARFGVSSSLDPPFLKVD